MRSERIPRAASSLVLLLVLSAACSLVRSFDGLSGDGSKSDAAAEVVDADAQRDVPDARDFPDGRDAADAEQAPLCAVETLWAGGSFTTGGATYLHGLTVSGDSVYVVGGNYQDNSPTNTTGFLKRIAKSAPHSTVDVATGLFRPRSVASFNGGLYFNSGSTLLRVDATAGPDAGGAVAMTTIAAIFDIHANDAGVYFSAGVHQAGAVIGYLPNGEAANASSQNYPNAARVVTTSSFAFVGRLIDMPDAGSVGLQRILRDGGLPRCVLQSQEPIFTLASDGSRVFWSGAGDGTTPEPVWWSREGECPSRTPQIYDVAHATHLASDGSLVFIGYKARATLFRLDENMPYCNVALPSAESQGVSATQNAIFDGDWVYFLTPVAVRRIRAR